MNPTFWVYVNEPNDKALIHQADYSFCKSGAGVQNEKSRHGLYDREGAICSAKRSGKKTIRWCGHCAWWLGINTEL